MSITSQTDRGDRRNLILHAVMIFISQFIYISFIYIIFLKISLSATKYLSNLVCIALD